MYISPVLYGFCYIFLLGFLGFGLQISRDSGGREFVKVISFSVIIHVLYHYNVSKNNDILTLQTGRKVDLCGRKSIKKFFKGKVGWKTKHITYLCEV